MMFLVWFPTPEQIVKGKFLLHFSLKEGINQHVYHRLIFDDKLIFFQIKTKKFYQKPF
jgi:hypothetical protein